MDRFIRDSMLGSVFIGIVLILWLLIKGESQMGLSEKKMAELGKLYEGAEAIEGSAGVPDGEYVALPEEIKLGESKNNNAQVVISWKVMEGEHEGEVQFDRNQCETAQNMGYLKAKMEVLGVTLPSHLKEWNAEFEEFTDKNKDLFTIKVVTSKDGFKNTYILGPSVYEKGETEDKGKDKGKSKGKEKEKEADTDTIDWDDFETDMEVKITDEDDNEHIGKLMIVREEYIKVEVDGKTEKFPKTEVKAIEKVDKKKKK